MKIKDRTIKQRACRALILQRARQRRDMDAKVAELHTFSRFTYLAWLPFWIPICYVLMVGAAVGYAVIKDSRTVAHYIVAVVVTVGLGHAQIRLFKKWRERKHAI